MSYHYESGSVRLSEQIKAAVSLRVLAERAGVAWDRRKSAPRRGDYWAPCPFHAERSASFHVLEPAGVGGFFKCFGCGRKGSAIDFVIEAEGVNAREALRRLATSAGIEREDTEGAARRAEAHARARAAEDAEAAARGLEAARRIWRATEPAGPLLESYLAARGVDLEALGGVPASLRFAPALEHWGGGADIRRDRPTHVGPARGSKRRSPPNRRWSAPGSAAAGAPSPRCRLARSPARGARADGRRRVRTASRSPRPSPTFTRPPRTGSRRRASAPC